jgi:succinoglycan biosynthesis protein ExoO
MLDRPIPEDENDFWISPIPPSGESIDVTVVIPAYQNEATLRRAVRSVLDQSLRNVEIIVGDDASTDSSRQLIADWLPDEPRLRAFRNRRNCGKSATMNRAIRFARGRWIAVLDGDDWYHPDRLAALVAIGEKSKADIVADNQFFYDAAAEAIVGPAWPVEGGDWALTFDDYLLGSNVYDNFDFGMLKPLVRTDFVRRTHLSYDERARYGEDFLYLLQFFILGGKAAICDAPYYFFTRPYGTLSRQWSHAMRKRYDFQLAHDLTQSYLRADAGVLTPHQLRHLKTRGRRLASLESYFRAKELLERRKWHGVLRCLVDHPGTLDCIARRLWERYVTRAATPVAMRVAQICRRRSVNGLPAMRDRGRLPFRMPALGYSRQARESEVGGRVTRGSPAMPGNGLAAFSWLNRKASFVFATQAIGWTLALLYLSAI